MEAFIYEEGRGVQPKPDSRNSLKASLPKRHMPYRQSRGGEMCRVVRQEHKFAITEAQRLQYCSILQRAIHEDPNNGVDGYMVRSLYFDTLNDYDYTTKIDGVDVRRKLRLRIYNTESAFASLEMKQKQSCAQIKRSIRIKREDAMQLCGGNYSSLLYYDDPFALECYTLMSTRGYLPKVIVEYRRTAFVAEGNETRVTFDGRIRATESCRSFFSDKLCLYPVMDASAAVLEVKYDRMLYTYIKDILQRFDKNPISVSKYCMARMISMGFNSL